MCKNEKKKKKKPKRSRFFFYSIGCTKIVFPFLVIHILIFLLHKGIEFKKSCFNYFSKISKTFIKISNLIINVCIDTCVSQFIGTHIDILGNETADSLTKETRNLNLFNNQTTLHDCYCKVMT